ncbi:MAG: AAA family ATPase [Prevotella sp.]|nr:AAA family ATPase [Prevotella sp.]
MAEKRRYGIGLQWFPDIIEKKTIYVDKTAFVHKLAHHGGKNYFLSRPRRFGKSLLLSTLQVYFEGRKELFKGLAVEQLEQEWTPYAVIRLDLSMGKYYDETSVDDICGGLLETYEKQYGLPVLEGEKLSRRLKNIILAAYEQTRRPVVILIDEYDAPMLDSIHKPDLQDHLRERVRDLFSPLKAQAQYLKFVLLTGISKFSQLSVFSELNNLSDLTFMPEFEGICGITEEELFTTLKPDLEWLTESMNERRRKNWTYDDCVQEVKRMYDGYHFSEKMTDIYNPWSLFYAFETGLIDNYWFSTGTPSSLINLMRVRQMVMPELERLEVKMSRFNAPTERITDPVPVLFQSGYLTIKDFYNETNTFALGFPNAEVREGFGESLYNYYTPDYYGSRDQMYITFWNLRRKRIAFEQFLESVRKWYAGIPYSITDKNQNEQFYQSLFYSLMVGIGADVEAEGQTSDGRFDIALKLQEAIYILEFKFNRTAEEATEQILKKDYAVRFAADPRPVYAVGLNISQDYRTIEQYEVIACK